MQENQLDFIRIYPMNSEILLGIAQTVPDELWGSAFVIGGVLNREVRRCGVFDVSARCQSSPDLKLIDSMLFSVFTSTLKQYVRDLGDLGKFVSEAGVSEDEGYSFLRYLPGEFYTLHTDNSTRKLPRTLSGIFVLNDNYGGGELCFPVQELTLKPKAGTVILFPSSFTHPHQVKAVMSGVRYSVVTWFR